MSKIAIIYWPKNGNTEKAALEIFEKLGNEKADLFHLNEIDHTIFDKYDNFIIGGSTVGADNWGDAHKGEKWGPFYADLKDRNANLKGKKIALYGLGNQITYPEHFVNDMKLLYDYFGLLGASFVGKWSIEGYEHTDSKALVGDKFLGLALDEENQYDLTSERIDAWLKQLEDEF